MLTRASLSATAFMASGHAEGTAHAGSGGVGGSGGRHAPFSPLTASLWPSDKGEQEGKVGVLGQVRPAGGVTSGSEDDPPSSGLSTCSICFEEVFPGQGRTRPFGCSSDHPLHERCMLSMYEHRIPRLVGCPVCRRGRSSVPIHVFGTEWCVFGTKVCAISDDPIDAHCALEVRDFPELRSSIPGFEPCTFGFASPGVNPRIRGRSWDIEVSDPRFRSCLEGSRGVVFDLDYTCQRLGADVPWTAAFCLVDSFMGRCIAVGNMFLSYQPAGGSDGSRPEGSLKCFSIGFEDHLLHNIGSPFRYTSTVRDVDMVGEAASVFLRSMISPDLRSIRHSD